MRILVGLGVLSLVYFLWWFADERHVGYAPLFWLLSVSLGFKLLRMLHEWYHYVNVSEPVAPTAPAATGTVPFTMDVLTTACPGEPRDMIEHTLRAMQAIRYPHTSYLCDEGDDPYLRQLCHELGVVHVTRQHKVNAKAGNINHALQQATGELCVVLDPDHAPTPDFLDQVVPYFQDAQVGYVQVVQAYGNQHQSLVARGAAEQTYHFYGPLMMGMHRYNTAQAIGANCTFRRQALDSIGGHAAGLTEDMHTAMRLHAQGWRSVYAPVIVSRGLVPASLGAYLAQQLKWARGAFDLLLHVYPRLFARFSARQRLHYLTLPLYFLSGLITLIDLAVPIASLILSVYPWHLSLPQFALHLAPLAGIGLLIRYRAQRWLREPQERGLHLAGGILRVGAWWVYCLGLLYTLLNIRVPYIPTPKDDELRNEWKLCLPNILTILLCAGAVKYAGRVDWTPYSRLMAFLATSNAAILFAAVGMGQHSWMRQLLADFASQPLRGIMDAGATAVRRLQHLAQRVSVPLAAGCLALVGAVDTGLYLKDQLEADSARAWAFNGGKRLRFGLQEPGFPESMTVSTQLLPSHGLKPLTSHTPPDIVSLSVTNQLPVAAMAASRAQGSIPMLSWQSTSRADAAELIRALRQTNQVVFVRPLLPDSLPATLYRQTWQRLVRQFRTARVRNVVWVWTPPQPAAVQTHFPGAAYLDWVAVAPTTPTTAGMAAYQPYRHELALNLALHGKPVMLLNADPRFRTAARSRRITQHYPEVKAVLFQAEDWLPRLPLLTSTTHRATSVAATN